ncbi:dienelactone hydrolase family protein [Micromonospora sp. NPDC007230]|uniref:dienelactone hydrolase family protein n=1 Tax=Micromonospora sp. NPDC007230 TaxID=3364237 RepID=UPI0036920DF3
MAQQHDEPVAHILLLHSVFGLRPAVLAAAARLRAAGHEVTTPDLYGLPAADTVQDGFALLDKVGRDSVLERARAAAHDLPAEAVLAGFSMGAGVAGALLAERPQAAALLLLHGTGGAPESVRPGLPVQLHLADPDEYEPPDELDEWRRAMTGAGAELSVYRYPGPGHLYTDPDVPDHDALAAALTWDRALAFLAG